MKRKILVTGASGFIGQHVTEMLGSMGHEVMAMTRRDVPAWDRLMMILSYHTWEKGARNHGFCRKNSPEDLKEPGIYSIIAARRL